MADKPASPFANLGLDKALLRSSQQRPTLAEPALAEPAASVEEGSSGQEGGRKRARPRASTHANGNNQPEGQAIERLHRRLQTKQHLASQTFRFHPEELAALDAASGKLKGPGTRGLSKNDLVRLGLNWLLADYEENGEESVLARVHARM